MAAGQTEPIPTASASTSLIRWAGFAKKKNQYLTCPPELAKDLPPELQALAGYAMGQYALGYYTRRACGESVVPPEYASGHLRWRDAG